MVFKGNGEVPLHIGFDQNGGSAPCEIRKIRVGYVTFFRSGVKKKYLKIEHCVDFSADFNDIVHVDILSRIKGAITKSSSRCHRPTLGILN